MFAELRDVVSLRVEAPRPVDISPECANMLERLCLAQAQELTFEKFRADGKNPAILARWQLLSSACNLNCPGLHYISWVGPRLMSVTLNDMRCS